MAEPAITIEPTGSDEVERCECCGHHSRTVWGLARRSGDADAAYFVHWALGRVASDGAHVDLICGRWGDGTAPADRYAVSLEFRRTAQGPAFRVIDASTRPIARNELVSRGLSRDEVVGTEIAARVFELADAIWLRDGRIGELTRQTPPMANDPDIPVGPGWASGVLPPVTIGVALTNLLHRRWRRAFQACMAPSGAIAFIAIMSAVPRFLPQSVHDVLIFTAWVLGPIPTLQLLRSLPWPPRPAARADDSSDRRAAAAPPRRLRRALILMVCALAFGGAYVRSTSSVRQAVQSVCDAAKVGKPPTDLEERARELRLMVTSYPQDVNAQGQQVDALIYVNGHSLFFYMYNCWIYHRDGKVVSARAAGGPQ